MDPNRPSTWRKFRPGLCEGCMAYCCHLPVEIKPSELVSMGLISQEEFELGEKYIAKLPKIKKYIKRFERRSNLYVLAQGPLGECLFLNEQRRCSIYEKRPETCRNHPVKGPRPGFCAYKAKDNI